MKRRKQTGRVTNFKGYDDFNNIQPPDRFESNSKKFSTLKIVSGSTLITATGLGAVVFAKGKGANGVKLSFGERMKNGWDVIFDNTPRINGFKKRFQQII